MKIGKLKMRASQAKNASQNEKMDENGWRMNWPSPTKYTPHPLIGPPSPPPFKSKIFWFPPKTQNSKIPSASEPYRGLHTMKDTRRTSITLNIIHTLFYCFYCWLWNGKCLLGWMWSLALITSVLRKQSCLKMTRCTHS